MSKGPKNTTTTTKSEPWGPAQGSLVGGLGDLNQWYASGAGRDPYPGSTVVPFSPFSTDAFSTAAARARDGSPVSRLGKDEFMKTLNGDYLDPAKNHWLSDTFDLAAGKVRGTIDSQFNKGSTYGSSLQQGMLGDAYNNLATSIYGGNYQTERGRQWDATQGAPAYAETDYNDPNHLLNIGQAYEQKAGETLKDSMDRYNFANNEPLQRLMQYFQLLNPIAGQGGSQATTTPNNNNGLSSTLGAIASIGSLFI